jgi:hypothetical protein
MRYAALIIEEKTGSAPRSPREEEADMNAIYAWFEKYSGNIIDGGAELDSVMKAKTVRRGVIVDGPHTDASEVISGVIFLETDTIDEAAGIALDWPGVKSGRTAIEVRPTVPR